MSRSKWKGPYLNILFNIKKINVNKKISFITVKRNSVITPKFLGLTFKIHNGKNFNELTVNDSMIGHKFGEFAFTRAQFSFKKKKSKK